MKSLLDGRRRNAERNLAFGVSGLPLIAAAFESITYEIVSPDFLSDSRCPTGFFQLGDNAT
jgi:hypothetical protein